MPKYMERTIICVLLGGQKTSQKKEKYKITLTEASTVLPCQINPNKTRNKILKYVM